MKSEWVYLIFSKYEKPNEITGSNEVLYAWTPSKDTLKLFMKQRNPKKYRVMKVDPDDPRLCSCDAKIMLEPSRIESKKFGRMVTLITTFEEIQRFQNSIVKLFKDRASLTRIAGNDPGDKLNAYVRTFLNIKPVFSEALDKIGFCPRETETLFDSDITDIYSDEFGDYEDYSGPRRVSRSAGNIQGMLYSLEGFIKVFKEYF
jgi:hypothetical protein